MIMTLWQAPSGRLHRHLRCSGNGRPLQSKRVKVTRKDWDRHVESGEVCRCALFGGWRADRTAQTGS